MAKTEESKSNDKHSNFNKHKNEPFNKEDFDFKFKVKCWQSGEVTLSTLKYTQLILNMLSKHSEAQNRRSFTPSGTIWNCKAETSNKDTSQILAEVKRILGCSSDQNEQFTSSSTENQI